MPTGILACALLDHLKVWQKVPLVKWHGAKQYQEIKMKNYKV
jgi:hypothetical protein